MSERIDDDILRYLRQIVMKAMDRIRNRMRGSDRLALKAAITSSAETKSDTNLTKGVDREAEDLILNSLLKKLPKMKGVERLAVFSEERGILTYPEDIDPNQAEWVAFIDPVDGTEFLETLQGGWSLLALYNRTLDRVEAAVAGDIFLNRLYWASQVSPPECIDFCTHSWFKLDGGPDPKRAVAGARINFLTTKVDRFLAVAKKRRLLDAMRVNDGRVNLSWGSNTIIQVAAGYADAAVEFDKGFATYDILPGLFIGEQAGLTILDMEGRSLSSRIDVPAVFSAWKADSKKPKRTKFVAAKERELASQIVELLRDDVEA
jgi:myo-inositol-1(or 4)-monophosphatase